jgi:hypothetical protein
MQQQAYQSYAAKQQADASKAAFDVQQAQAKQGALTDFGSGIAKLFAPTQMVDPSAYGPNPPTPGGAFVGPGEVPRTPAMMQAAMQEQAPGLIAKAVSAGLDPAKGQRRRRQRVRRSRSPNRRQRCVHGCRAEGCLDPQPELRHGEAEREQCSDHGPVAGANR